jgi:signal transduction histidine kinase
MASSMPTSSSTSSNGAARRAGRAAAALAGRVELVHAALEAALHLAHADAACLWLDGRAGGTVSLAPPSTDCHAGAPLERAARDAAARQLQRQDAGLSLVGAPLGGVGGLAAASSAERAFAPREVAVLATLGQQAGAAIDGWGSERPFWAIGEGVFDAAPEAGWPDALIDGLLWLDADGRVVRANRAALELLEPSRRAGARHGQRLAELAPELPAEVMSALGGTAAGAALSVSRIALGAPSARPRPVTLVVLPGEGGRLLLLSDAAARADVRAFEALVVSDAAHELRTPLTAIRAHAELVPDLIEADAEHMARRFLEVIDVESQRMGGLLDDLRDALRTEGPSLVLHRRAGPEDGR